MKVSILSKAIILASFGFGGFATAHDVDEGFRCIVYDLRVEGSIEDQIIETLYTDSVDLDEVEEKCIDKMRELLPEQGTRNYEIDWTEFPKNWEENVLGLTEENIESGYVCNILDRPYTRENVKTVANFFTTNGDLTAVVEKCQEVMREIRTERGQRDFEVKWLSKLPTNWHMADLFLF